MSVSPLPSHLHATTPLDYFGSLVADDRHFALFEAAVCVAQDEVPDLDAQQVLAEVDEMARRLRGRLAADAAPVQRLRMLSHFFFQELGFAGNVNDYYDVGNSYVHAVLRSRRGIPITLAVLYMEIASQIGLKVHGISFPGHFLVKCSMSQGEVIIDPFTGRSLSREELDERLQPYRIQQGLTGDFDVPLGLFLQSAAPRDILARLLRNLKEIHRTAEDWPRLLAVANRLVLVVPQDWSERRDRGLVHAELEQWSAAAEDLAAYLEHRSDAPDAAALTERLQELRRLAQLH